MDPNSKTETFVAARLLVDNWRWKDVPFYLRTGKRMAKKDTEIVVTFKEIPHSLFGSVGLDANAPECAGLPDPAGGGDFAAISGQAAGLENLHRHAAR